MKRKLLFLSAFIVSAISASAQWHIQDTKFAAASRGIKDINPVDSNVVWAVGYDGTSANTNARQYTRTRTGGGTWFPGSISVPNNYDIANISAIDFDTAYASIYPASGSATQQGVYKTTNSGNTWKKVSTGAFGNAASFINCVHMFDAQHGVAMGDPVGGFFEIWTTSNYGNSWTRVPQADIPFAPINANEFGTVGYFAALDSTVWYSTNFGRVLVSNDMGLTWQLGTTPHDSTQDVAIPSYAFKDKMNGWAIITDGDAATIDEIMKTTDGGLTWTTFIDTATAGVFDRGSIAYVPGTANTIFVATVNTNSLGKGSAFSEDGGLTWLNIDAEQHNGLAFTDMNNGWSGSFNVVNGGVSTEGMFKWGSQRAPDTATVGIVRDKNSNLFQLFPNPSNGLVYIDARVKGNTTVRVMDLTGRVVMEKQYKTVDMLITSLDLSSVAKGLYVVEFNNEGKVATKRVAIN